MMFNVLLRRRISSAAFKESLSFLEKEQAATALKSASTPATMAETVVDQYKLGQLLNVGRAPAQKYIFKRLHELDNHQWKQAKGPEFARELGKAYGVLRDVLPYETEAEVNLSLCFGGQTWSRFGNLITPEKTGECPVISFRPRDASKLYSVFMFDADYPDERAKRLQHHLLLSFPNIKPDGLDADVRLDASSEAAHAFQPPHPARGTSTHRILTVLMEHDQPYTIDEARTTADLLKAMKEGGVVCGYTFFRTCWTRAVSEMYKDGRLEGAEPMYGEYKAPIPVRPYKYANA